MAKEILEVVTSSHNAAHATSTPVDQFVAPARDVALHSCASERTRKRTSEQISHVNQEQNDKKSRFSPSQFLPQGVRRCRRSAREIVAIMGFQTLCAVKSTEFEAVETDEASDLSIAQHFL